MEALSDGRNLHDRSRINAKNAAAVAKEAAITGAAATAAERLGVNCQHVVPIEPIDSVRGLTEIRMLLAFLIGLTAGIIVLYNLLRGQVATATPIIRLCGCCRSCCNGLCCRRRSDFDEI